MSRTLVPTTPNASQPPVPESEERLEQVRELLFGETARSLEDRVVELTSALADAHTAMGERTETLLKELEDLRRRSVDRAELASALRQLADVVDGGAQGSTPSKNP